MERHSSVAAHHHGLFICFVVSLAILVFHGNEKSSRMPWSINIALDGVKMWINSQWAYFFTCRFFSRTNSWLLHRNGWKDWFSDSLNDEERWFKMVQKLVFDFLKQIFFILVTKWYISITIHSFNVLPLLF